MPRTSFQGRIKGLGNGSEERRKLNLEKFENTFPEKMGAQ
jgi:hypothetical protein